MAASNQRDRLNLDFWRVVSPFFLAILAVVSWVEVEKIFTPSLLSKGNVGIGEHVAKAVTGRGSPDAVRLRASISTFVPRSPEKILPCGSKDLPMEI
jgi:hypothetical protein